MPPLFSISWTTAYPSLTSFSEAITRLIGMGVTMVIALLVFFSGKKFITVPRMGIIKFKRKQKAEKKKFVLILIVLIIITGIFYILMVFDLIPFEAYVSAVVFGIFFAIPISLLANFLRIDRYYLYAILGGLSFFISELSFSLSNNPFAGFLAFIITGSLIIIIGLIFLYRFLRQYPVQIEEMME